MIALSEAVIYLVSKSSASSRVCDDEISYAQALGKRIVPAPLEKIDFSKVSPRLSALNIAFDFSNGLTSELLGRLESALNVDVAWHREHCRLTALADRWQRGGKHPEDLLSEANLRASNSLLEERPREAGKPSPILVEFRNESRKLHAQRALTKRRQQVLTTVLLSCVIASLSAWIYQDKLKSQWFWLTSVQPYRIQIERELTLVERDVFRDCRGCPEMIVVPMGSFTIGSNRSPVERDRNKETPTHSVEIAYRLAIRDHCR